VPTSPHALASPNGAHHTMGMIAERVRHLFDESGSLTDQGRVFAVVAYLLVVLVVLRRGKLFLIKLFPSNVREYAPYRQDARGKDTICVDCTHPNLPTLTHHKGSSTPEHLKGDTGDTSTDIVLNALTDPSGWQPMRVATKVTCDHFDVDGVLSVWACVHPFAARKHERLLRTIARLGDFREVDFDANGSTRPNSLADAALRFCTWMNAVEAREFSKPFEGNEAEASEKKYDYFLRMIESVLEELAREIDIDREAAADSSATRDDSAVETQRAAAAAAAASRRGRLGMDAGDEERRVVLSDAKRLFDAAKTRVRFHEDLGIAFVETEGGACHYYALFSVVKSADVVVFLGSGGEYEVESRYVGFVDYRSRPTTPRMDLSVLAEKLNSLEETHGGASVGTRGATPPALRWDCAGFTDSGPLLRLNDPNRRLTKAERYGSPRDRPIFKSNIPPGVFITVATSFFRHGLESIAGNRGASSVAKVGWTWKETRDARDAIDWGKWEVPRNDQ